MSYEVPDKLADALTLGSIVRVPLKNRRVRGWVVGVGDRDESKVLPIFAASGRGPIFDRALLDAMKGLARRYVRPLAEFLSLLTPARLGRPVKLKPPANYPKKEGAGFLVRPGSEDPLDRYVELVKSALADGRSAIVAVPEVRDGSRVVSALAAHFGDEAAVVHSGIDPAQRSAELWKIAAGERRVVLGGRASLFVPPLPSPTIILHLEDDPSFKEQRAPYYDARVVAEMRSRFCGGPFYLVSPTPSLRSMAQVETSLRLIEPPRERVKESWPIVETVPPSKTGMPRRTIAALIEGHRNGGKSLIVLPRSESTRAGPGVEQTMRFVSRVIPNAHIARADRAGLESSSGGLTEALKADIVIGTEAMLSDIEHPAFAVAVALDIDLYLTRPQGRVVEEAFASLWRLGSMATGVNGRGRFLLETATPEHHVPQALVRGDYKFFARHELEARGAVAAPPHTHLIKVVTAAAAGEPVSEQIRALPGVDVLGPAESERGAEILLKTRDIKTLLDGLGSIVRSSNHRISVEVDPRDW